MAPRRRRRAKKKANALGHFISRDAHEMDRLIRQLNTRWIGKDAALGEQVAAVIQATAALPYPAVPRAAADLFVALAEGQSFQYRMQPVEWAPTVPAAWRQHGLALVFLEHSDELGYAVLELGRFFRNPARGRLRRCQQCATWFLDTTRNQSARRCSKACTIAWSNRQRNQRKEHE